MDASPPTGNLKNVCPAVICFLRFVQPVVVKHSPAWCPMVVVLMTMCVTLVTPGGSSRVLIGAGVDTVSALPQQ